MRTEFDLSPLYRSTVGFDRLFNLLDSTMGAAEASSANWPPYNIERLGEDQYRITMAVAGFTPEEINLVQQENTLLVEARKHPEPEGVQVLHRGIANRAFRQTFNLADYVKVSGANLENGLLVIDLVREVPEAMRPRRIEIAAGGGPKCLSGNISERKSAFSGCAQCLVPEGDLSRWSLRRLKNPMISMAGFRTDTNFTASRRLVFGRRSWGVEGGPLSDT
jgi:molecular chaperone IbpA